MLVGVLVISVRLHREERRSSLQQLFQCLDTVEVACDLVMLRADFTDIHGDENSIPVRSTSLLRAMMVQDTSLAMHGEFKYG